jgi:hypothetical protein
MLLDRLLDACSIEGADSSNGAGGDRLQPLQVSGGFVADKSGRVASGLAELDRRPGRSAGRRWHRSEPS